MSKNLVIDIGNSEIKAGIFLNDDLINDFVLSENEAKNIEHFLIKHEIENCILSNVGNEIVELEKALADKTFFVKLNSETKIPFANLYATPTTLGADRIALIAASNYFFAEKNCLVIDAGTCVTFDFINSTNEYLGGAISPGLQMRLNAMHTFTNNLPQLNFEKSIDFNGNSTENCMQSGAFFGLIEEIKGRIKLYENRFGNVQTLLCGGDSEKIMSAINADETFVNELKNKIFAHPKLILYGLNKILKFNAAISH